MIAYGATIVAWACAHDLYLIGVEPRHFTVHHRPLLPITHHGLLAIQYAFVATLGPGMVFGAVTWAACQLGSWPRLGLRWAWGAFLPCVALIETSALAVGAWAGARYAAGDALPYPALWYPDDTAGIAYSQSVNITAYLAAAGFGLAYQLALLAWRRRLASTAGSAARV